MKNILIFCLLFVVVNTYAQKHDYIWQMGFGGTTFNPASLIDFNYSNDSTYIVNRPNVDRTNGSICDSLGNFLFYTNGIQVIDSSYQVMPNGDSLNPGWVADDWSSNGSGYPFPESALILPVPQHDSLYHIYHLSVGDDASTIDGLFYTVVNMNGNNGKGVVTAKNQMLMGGGLTFELEAMKHANGEDWWIVATEMFQNGFYRFLLTKDSITGPFYQQIGASMHGNYFSQATFSPDGAKFARFDTYNDLDVFDFDRCTGLLSNNQHITIVDTIDTYAGGGFSGIVFSPSSQYLYVNSGGYSVYQFDILANSIAASIDTVAIYDGYYQLTPSNGSTFFLGQLAPNGKIYFNSWSNLDVLHVIHSPDSAGAACNFEQHGFQLPSAGLTLPNFPHFRTPALSVPCDTVTSTTAIEAATEEDWVTVYPNPASSDLFIESTQNIETILVYNTLGQLVIQEINVRQKRIPISTASLENGTYFVSLLINGTVVNQTFQVLH